MNFTCNFNKHLITSVQYDSIREYITAVSSNLNSNYIQAGFQVDVSKLKNVVREGDREMVGSHSSRISEQPGMLVMKQGSKTKFSLTFTFVYSGEVRNKLPV